YSSCPGLDRGSLMDVGPEQVEQIALRPAGDHTEAGNAKSQIASGWVGPTRASGFHHGVPSLATGSGTDGRAGVGPIASSGAGGGCAGAHWRRPQAESFAGVRWSEVFWGGV